MTLLTTVLASWLVNNMTTTALIILVEFLTDQERGNAAIHLDNSEAFVCLP